jgi:hypothetical protein
VGDSAINFIYDADLLHTYIQNDISIVSGKYSLISNVLGRDLAKFASRLDQVINDAILNYDNESYIKKLRQKFNRVKSLYFDFNDDWKNLDPELYGKKISFLKEYISSLKTGNEPVDVVTARSNHKQVKSPTPWTSKKRSRLSRKINENQEQESEYKGNDQVKTDPETTVTTPRTPATVPSTKPSGHKPLKKGTEYKKVYLKLASMLNYLNNLKKKIGSTTSAKFDSVEMRVNACYERLRDYQTEVLDEQYKGQETCDIDQLSREVYKLGNDVDSL